MLLAVTKRCHLIAYIPLSLLPLLTAEVLERTLHHIELKSSSLSVFGRAMITNVEGARGRLTSAAVLRAT